MNGNDKSEDSGEVKEPRRDLYGPLADSITWDGSRPKTVPVVVEPKPRATEETEESGESQEELKPRSRSPKILTGPTDFYIEKIKECLVTYIDDQEVFNDFQPMKEWDLSTQGKLSETDILQAYAMATNLPVIDEEELDNVDRFPEITFEYLNHWLCLPISWDSDTVVIVVVTPYYTGNIAYHWRHLLGRKARFCLGKRSLLERHLNAIYNKLEEELDEGDLKIDGDATEATLRDLALEAPIVRLVNDMFSRAVEMGASDIHVEPSENHLAIRFRVDGVLQTVMTPPIATYPAIASRIKLIGGLNIAERRLPQDGRTDLHIGRAQVDIRISTLPAIHGESIVLRLLRKDITSFSLENIGMDQKLKKPFTQMVRLPFGMILVVGPTGSGKTTTLYCVMNLLDTEGKKIITIEDPVEYQMKGVTQIQVKPAIGLTFANGLRSIVRQDPDIILVGEIRDRETAEIAIHSALTGHLVLSTLHTNDATGAISRLVDMGVEPFLITSALVGVLSQRLVRRICTTCQGKGVIQGANGQNGPGRSSGASSFDDQGAKSCRNCNSSGFRGRVGIFEFLKVNEDIRKATNDGADNAILNAIARKSGMKTLRESGQEKIKEGITTETEVTRVCQLEFE